MSKPKVKNKLQKLIWEQDRRDRSIGRYHRLIKSWLMGMRDNPNKLALFNYKPAVKQFTEAAESEGALVSGMDDFIGLLKQLHPSRLHSTIDNLYPDEILVLWEWAETTEEEIPGADDR